VALVRIWNAGLKCAARGLLKIQDAKDHQKIAMHTIAQLCWAVFTTKASVNNRKLECGPMPNLMVALLNIGGALCSTPQSLADTHY